jgi:hypothetical protein
MRQLNLEESEQAQVMLGTVGWAVFEEFFTGRLGELEEEINQLVVLSQVLEREQLIGARKHLAEFISQFNSEIIEQVNVQRRKINE